MPINWRERGAASVKIVIDVSQRQSAPLRFRLRGGLVGLARES